MEMIRVLIEAVREIALELNFEFNASVNVNLPNFLKGSAIKNKATTQPARKPMAYKNPSNPETAIIPQIPKKEAAER